MGCCTIARARRGIPSVPRSSSASPLNLSVYTVTVGTPRVSSSTASWTLHDVQEPQSPMPTITALTEVANLAINSFAAGVEELGLLMCSEAPMW